MEKTDLGFQCEIELLSNDSFNFCFRNGKNEWDNNDNQNYIFPIEKAQAELIKQEDLYSIAAPRRLRKSYLWSKKIRLAIYKILVYVPRLISGNYKRKVINN